MRRVGLFGGMGALFESIGWLVTTPSVWGWAIIPVAIAVLLMTSLSVLGVWGSDLLVNHLLSGGSAWAEVGACLLKALAFALAIVVALLVALALAQPLSGFALEAIARAQERKLGGTEWPKQKSAFLRSLGVNLTSLALGLPILAILTLVDLIFPPAATVCVPLKFVVSALMIAWDFLDYPLSVRGLSIGARLTWIRTHFLATLGFGLAAGFVLLVPGVGLLLLPVGVAGAARLVVAVDRAG
jgi:CysZ protein